MSRFVLTAQLQLQAPNNVAQVVRQIQSQLNNVTVNVQVQNSAQAQRQLQQVTAQTQAATTAADRMGRAFAMSVRRFAAFSIATRTVSLFTSTLSDAIKTAIDFERQMIKISQVTGDSMTKLKGLTKTITNLATGFGVGSQSLLEASTLLLQAGISAKDTEVALKTLAKAALAPNFDGLSETTEGAIAILAQFGEGVGALEKQLGSINAVAGAFAVEAGDLIDVIRRAGGVFKSSGGELNELIALFTSVRATTRESAESIGTGLRTIFTRIQRPKTIEYLKQFGVELIDLNGKFVGPFEAVKRLSGALAGLGEGDTTFIRIAEELGGFRQIGKVLPLLQQFTVAQNALNVANKAGNSLTSDAVTAQQALAIRITKVKEEFLALVRGITETSTFQVMANTALTLASALIKIGEAIKPLLPLLAAVAAVNFTRGIGSFIGSFARGMQSGRTFNKGGKVHHFARGGFVPGTGNRDTVPAMLQPGEFVIRKSSVNKLGASTLAAMNENRYATGGPVVAASLPSAALKKRVKSANSKEAQKNPELFKKGYYLTDTDKIFFNKKEYGLQESSSINASAFEDRVIQAIGGSKPKSKTAPVDVIGSNKGNVEVRNRIRTTKDKVLLDKFLRQRILENKPLIPNQTRGEDLQFPDTVSVVYNTGKLSRGRFEQLNLGGLIEKFAQGGLVSQDKIAGAILENTGFSNKDKITVKKQEIESKLDKSLRLTDNYPIKSQKQYTLQKEGLSQSTFKNFKDIIDVNLAAAAQNSAQSLGSDLGLAAKTAIPQDSLKTFLQGVNDGSVANLFEDTLKVLVGPPFSTDPRRAFDFSNGISNILKDDYKNITAQYVDAKSSIQSAGPSAFQTKVANQLATEAKELGFARAETAEETKYRKSAELRASIASGLAKKSQKKYFGGIIQKFARGGAVDTLEKFYKGESSIGGTALTPENKKKMTSEQRKVAASELKDLRSLRSFAPEELYTSISRVAFDSMASQIGFNKNLEVAPGSTIREKQDLIDQQAKKAVGKSFRLSGLLSTSKDYGVAKRFLDNAPRSQDRWAALLNIATKKNAQGVDVVQGLRGRKINATKQELNPRTGKMETYYMDQPESENEMILPPNSRFKINSSKFVETFANKNLWMDVQQFAKGGKAQSVAKKYLGGGKYLDEDQVRYLARLEKDMDNNIKERNKLSDKLNDRLGKVYGKKIQKSKGQTINIGENIGEKDKSTSLAINDWLTGIHKIGDRDFNRNIEREMFDFEKRGLELDAKKDPIIAQQEKNKLLELKLEEERLRKEIENIKTNKQNKTQNFDKEKMRSRISSAFKKFATGGGVGTDTVPALLTPGEFVINRKSAQNIGYGALSRMNKVGRYANGGIVQRFNQGGMPDARSSYSSGMDAAGSNKMFATTMAISMIGGFLPAIDENSSALLKLTHYMLGLGTVISGVMLALESFGVALGANQILQLFGSGPGGLGSIIKNAFSGFKMGAAGMAGPMLPGGGIASRAGSLFANAKSAIGRKLTYTGTGSDTLDTIGNNFINSDFGRGISAGLKGKSIIGGGSKSILANAGGFLGQGAGIIGRGATGVSGAIGNFAGVAARGVGAIGSRLGGAAIGAAGPIAAVTGIVSVINGAIGAYRDLDGQLKKSIEAGKVEEAARLSVAQKASEFPIIGNIFSSIFGEAGDKFLLGIGEIFGGPTLKSVEARGRVEAGAIKTQKALEQAQKTATQAMQDFENGTITASEALARVSLATQEATDQEKRARDFAAKNTANRAAEGFTGRNIASALTFGLVESAQARNTRLGKESAEKTAEARKFSAQAFDIATPLRSAAIRQNLFRGTKTREQIREEALGGPGENNLKNRRQAAIEEAKKALRRGDTEGYGAAMADVKQFDEQIKQVDREIENLGKEIQIAKNRFNALNLGLRSVTAAADASALRMSKAMNSFDLAVVPGTNAIATLEASLTAAGQNISKVEFDAALSGVSNILKKFGADAKQVSAFEDLTKGVATVQREFPNIFETLKDRLNKGELRNLSPENLGKEFKKIVGQSLDKAGIGEAAKKRIMDAMGDVKIDPADMAKIMAGDVSVLEKYIGDAAEEVSKNIKAFGEKWISANQELIKATQQRIEAERNLVNAQREAIDLYMEGRDIQARYGGQAVSIEERRAANLARANAGAANAGLRSMRSGDIADIRARNNQIVTRFGAIESRRGGPNSEMGAAGQNLEGIQQNLEAAQKTQIQFIKEEIKIREDELKIIQEKNRLEKESLESLISGDIEKFFDQQAAMGAQAAIATGDMNAANIFGAKAVTAAFEDMKRQMEAGVTTLFGMQLGGAGGLVERGAMSALGARGVMDPRAAQVLAGTTAQEESVKRTLRELGGVLGETGGVGAALAEMQVQTAQMKIDSATLVINNLSTGGVPAVGKANGGLIYANRGIFVPRGTDTVPAMLTPGEFVVRREAVNRGNNLQLLRAINNGGNTNGFARGGKVGYYNNGGNVQYKATGDLVSRIGQAIGIDPQIITNLTNVFTLFTNSFNDSIKKLQQTKLQIQLDNVNVNVNLNGKAMLAELTDQTKQGIMSQVINKIQNEYRIGPNGKLIQNSSSVGGIG